MSCIRALPAALALCLVAGCADRVPELPTGPARPAMWVIHDADTRIVILGAVHQLPPGLNWTGGRLETELRLADELLLELSPEESAAAGALFAAQSHDETVPSLTARFGAQADPVLDLVSDVGMDEQDADATESWALALAIGNALSQRSGLASNHGVETELTTTFRRRSLPVGGLETAQEQLSMFDALSPAQQDIMVRATLNEAGNSVARTRRLLAAWAASDIDGLTAVAEDAVTETPFLVEPMIRARNRAWATMLLSRLERPGDILVAVGVGHLVSDGSLLEELRARGFRPIRLQ